MSLIEITLPKEYCDRHGRSEDRCPLLEDGWSGGTFYCVCHAPGDFEKDLDIRAGYKVVKACPYKRIFFDREETEK